MKMSSPLLTRLQPMLLCLMALLATGCSTLSAKNSNYREISIGQFLTIASNPPSSNFMVQYAGSDTDYDYIYTRVAAILADNHFKEYKLKRGLLNLPDRYDFEPYLGDPQKQTHNNYRIIGNKFLDGIDFDPKLKWDAQLKKLLGNANETVVPP